MKNKVLAVLLAMSMSLTMLPVAMADDEAAGTPPTDEITDTNPGDGEQVPGDGEQQPGDGEQQPGDGEQQPGDGEQQPGDGEQQPGDGEQQPGDGEQQPGDGDEEPGESVSVASEEDLRKAMQAGGEIVLDANITLRGGEIDTDWINLNLNDHQLTLDGVKITTHGEKTGDFPFVVLYGTISLNHCEIEIAEGDTTMDGEENRVALLLVGTNVPSIRDTKINGEIRFDYSEEQSNRACTVGTISKVNAETLWFFGASVDTIQDTTVTGDLQFNTEDQYDRACTVGTISNVNAGVLWSVGASVDTITGCKLNAIIAYYDSAIGRITGNTITGGISVGDTGNDKDQTNVERISGNTFDVKEPPVLVLKGGSYLNHLGKNTYTDVNIVQVQKGASIKGFHDTTASIDPDSEGYVAPYTVDPEDEKNDNYITITSSDNGTVTPSTRYAESGERVSLFVKAGEGYELDTITVKDIRGRSITCRSLGDDSYYFIMPDGKVTVEAKFVKTEDTTTTPTTPAAPAVDEPFTSLGTPGVSGIVLNPAAMPFTDVKSTDWFYNNVEYMWKHYLMSGTSENRFDPNVTTSRAMIWTIVARMNNVRTDINPGSTWYEKGLLWCKEKGLTDGSDPMGDITREQLATMLWRNAGQPGGNSNGDLTQFSDSASVSGYAQTAMRWAVANGILYGDNGRLDPQGTATRAQVAAMIARYGDKIASK